jgi:hypothetical protein
LRRRAEALLAVLVLAHFLTVDDDTCPRIEQPTVAKPMARLGQPLVEWHVAGASAPSGPARRGQRRQR